MSAPAAASTAGVAPGHDFAANVFHDLSQPLTALHCSLELALARDQTIEEFRASVEAALHNAERLRQRLLLLRELSDADDPGDTVYAASARSASAATARGHASPVRVRRTIL